MIGKTLLHYQIIDKLGEGGMGVVWKARDTHLDRFVALKLLAPEQLADEDRRRRFVQEAKAASALNHPNIIHVYDITEADGIPFIAMEYVDGKTLTASLPIGLVAGLRIACQLASALAKAHSAGVTHRDIKPGNIMLTEDGGIKLLDFGLAKLAPPVDVDQTTLSMALTQSGVVVGTPAYMSPEQAWGRRVDARSDIFSFGLLLYEMFSGRRAFSGKTPEATMEAILYETPPPLRSLVPQAPPELESIVMRCLDKELARRFQSMIEVKLALDDLAARGIAGQPRPSIAVLPFANLSTDKENDYFADGLTEEIINLLAQTAELNVIARTSSFSFRDKNVPVEEIARKLKVGHVLEGSVRKTGSRIRVTAQLVKASDGFHLWSDRFDGELADIFTVQEEIARAITTALAGAFSRGVPPAHLRQRPELDAYNAYLKGRYYLHQLTPDALAKAKEHFDSAIALDPNSAVAYSGLALYHTWGPDAMNDRVKVGPLLDKALELDPGLAEAHGLRASHLAMFQYDWQAAEQSFHKALTSSSVPAEVYYHYSQFLLALGRFDDALLALDRARQIDPLVPTYVHAAANVHYCAGDFQRAIKGCEEALELDDRYWPGHLTKGWVLLATGNTTQASELIDRLQQRLGGNHPMIVHIKAACDVQAGRIETVRETLRAMLESRSERRVSPWLLGALCDAIGDFDQALQFMEEALEKRDPRVLWFVTAHRFPTAPGSLDLRGNPRFQSLLRKMNLGGSGAGTTAGFA